MKLNKRFRSTGTLISTAGLGLSVLGILMAQSYIVGADSLTTADVDFATTMLFVGAVIILAGLIVIFVALFSD